MISARSRKDALVYAAVQLTREVLDWQGHTCTTSLPRRLLALICTWKIILFRSATNTCSAWLSIMFIICWIWWRISGKPSLMINTLIIFASSSLIFMEATRRNSLSGQWVLCGELAWTCWQTHDSITTDWYWSISSPLGNDITILTPCHRSVCIHHSGPGFLEQKVYNILHRWVTEKNPQQLRQ